MGKQRLTSVFIFLFSISASWVMPFACLMPDTTDSQVSNQSELGPFLWLRPGPAFAWLPLGSAGAANCLHSGWDAPLFLAQVLCCPALATESLLARMIPLASAAARLIGTSVSGGLFQVEPRMAPFTGYSVQSRAKSPLCLLHHLFFFFK